MFVPTVKDIEQVVKQPNKLLTTKEDTTVAEAAKKMSAKHVGCLLVFDDKNRFTGILTERDMLSKVFQSSPHPDDVLVRDIMTSKPITCTIKTAIAKIEQLMDKHKIRHVPVVENGVPVAMVSSRDIIAYQLHSSKAMKDAAEQLTMLSTGLKSLDFDDVIALAINEVPKSFGADRAVLYLESDDPSKPMIYRKNCPLAEETLLNMAKSNKLPHCKQTLFGQLCDQCRKLGGQAPRLIIPLSISERSVKNDRHTIRQGLLCICDFNAHPEENARKLQLYKASLLQEVLNVNLTNARLYQNYQKARRDSETDPLTDVGTRRVLEKMLKAEHERAMRYNHCFSVAIVDLDNFKQINDNAGHAAGDRALQLLAKFIMQNARKTDTTTRYGGDEFVLLMPETKLKDAVEMLERMRHQIKSLVIPHVKSVTISCGLTEWNGTADDTPELIFKRADQALYKAKKKGRNRVVATQTAKHKV